MPIHLKRLIYILLRIIDLTSSKFTQLKGYDKSSPPDKPTNVHLLFKIDQVINIDDHKNVRDLSDNKLYDECQSKGAGGAGTPHSEVG